MARLTSIQDVVNWVRIDLGVPAVCLELPEATIEQVIEDAIDYYQKHAYTEGAYEDYIPLNISAGVSAYDVSGYDVAAVVELNQIRAGSGHGLNTLFSSQLNVLGSGWTTLGNGGYGQGLGLSNYEMATQYIDLIDLYFQKTFRVFYRTGAEKLHVAPMPTEDGVALIHIYKKEAAQYIYNQELFKELVRARVMVRWGFILNKRTITLPGGGTINGQFIYDEGKDLEEKVRQRIYDEQYPTQPMIG
jgi:hypothetical protein